MKYTIRHAILSDVSQLAVLFDEYRIFYLQQSDIEIAIDFITKRIIQNESAIFVAEDQQNNLLGFTQLYPSFSSVSVSRNWILNDLFVVLHARRFGVAKSLMNVAKQFGIETGAKSIVLETGVENTIAQRFYESLGYVRDSTSLHYSLLLINSIG